MTRSRAAHAHRQAGADGHFGREAGAVAAEAAGAAARHPIGFSYSTIVRPQGRFWRVTLKRTW